MAEVGVEEAALVPSGGIDALVAGVEEAGMEEAAEGMIIDTTPGAYSFTFLKKTSSSERGRP
jgi:hypothetical protein